MLDYDEKPRFKTHNIRLLDGSVTIPTHEVTLEQTGWFKQIVRLLQQAFHRPPGEIRVVDLGCCEGGLSIELARIGYAVVGIDVRKRNIDLAETLKEATGSKNVSFIQADVSKFIEYGKFDVVLCWGLLYHLDNPEGLLDKIGEKCGRLLILSTHYAPGDDQPLRAKQYGLSDLTYMGSLRGRWYKEFDPDAPKSLREAAIWSSFKNDKSFWIQKEHLIQKLRRVGFDEVAELFGGISDPVAEDMLSGVYYSNCRGVFAGIKDNEKC